MKSGWIAIAVTAAACAGAPATPEQRRLLEQRLLEPFSRGLEVGCAELQIDLTSNFHGHVGQPATDPMFHTFAKDDRGDCRESIWTNTAGDPAHAFVISIGEPPEMTERGSMQKPRTTFRVVNQVRLRVWEDRRPLQLDAAATGTVVLVREPRGIPREVREFVVVDGMQRSP